MKIPKIQHTSCRIPKWVNPEVAATSIDFAIKCKVRHLEVTEGYRVGDTKMKNIIFGIKSAIEETYPVDKGLETSDYMALGNLTSLCMELIEEAVRKGKPWGAAIAWSQAVKIILRIKRGIDEERRNAQ